MLYSNASTVEILECKLCYVLYASKLCLVQYMVKYVKSLDTPHSMAFFYLYFFLHCTRHQEQKTQKLIKTQVLSVT